MKFNLLLSLFLLVSLPAFSQSSIQTMKEKKGTVVSPDGDIAIRVSDRIHGYGAERDEDINSPKSATFSKDGKKIYVNSLEGAKTVVYDAATHKKLKVINHQFDSGTGPLWLPASGFYEFTHYPGGEQKAFSGKPVEAALSKDGRYLFVPYYRRTFDINAQDPSAIAVIDTQKDEIVLMAETGPLPKMVRVSLDGKLLAITHWGNNTVGFMDISDRNPRNWKHLPPVTIGKKLDLNYSLTSPVNRDSGSGFLLRGTVFLPGDSLLLVSGMAGPLNVIDTRTMEWIGTVRDMGNVRHLTLKGDMLYLSRNSAGEVLTVPVANIVKAISEQRSSSREFRVDGVRRAKVAGGARTLKVSPEGKYIFVACNTGTEIAVVRTEDMKVVAEIKADPFPVGLDISPDGTQLVSTSQGRKGHGGGNAVNFFEIGYLNPEKYVIEAVGSEVDADSAAADSLSAEQMMEQERKKDSKWWAIGLAIGIAVLIAFTVFARRKSRK